MPTQEQMANMPRNALTDMVRALHATNAKELFLDNPAVDASRRFLDTAGAAPGVAADALGITDAVKALRGQMTEEEQRDFASMAALGAIPAVGVAGKAVGAGIRGVKNLLGERAIAKALEKNPGASIFDIAGMREKAPNEIPADNYVDWPTLSASLPRDPPWKIPQPAAEAGYTVQAHHGTRVPEDFDKFKLPEQELGVHFGSPRAAGGFAYMPPDILSGDTTPDSTLFWNSKSGRVYPTVLQAKKPLELPDLGTWESRKVIKGLKANYPGGEFEGLPDNNLMGGNDMPIADLRNQLKARGYDAIQYQNKYEDPGHTSHILFNESPKDPGYIKGAKSPWAAFKDLDSANLLSGVAGAGVVGGATANDDMVRALLNPKTQDMGVPNLDGSAIAGDNIPLWEKAMRDNTDMGRWRK